MTPTLFSLLIKRCGLSLSEAASYLNVRLDTVKSWSSGRNPTPEGVIDELKSLNERVINAAHQTLDKISDLQALHGDNFEIELSVCTDDHEAQSLGWPFASVHQALVGHIAAMAACKTFIVQRKLMPSSVKTTDCVF